MDTFERLIAVTGHRLELVPVLGWSQISAGRGRIAFVPDQLPRLPTSVALRTVRLPIHLDWSSPTRVVDLADRRQRLQAYEVVLREGRPVDIETLVDGALLTDGWAEMVLPSRVREAWQPLIDRTAGHA